MPNIITRSMEPQEAALVQRIGRQSFTGMERLMVSKPKQGIVAEADGEIAGAILYKIMNVGGKKIGYIDYAFVHPRHQGRGIGNVLYKDTCSHLWEQGCDALTALVKDDNVASWGLFIKNNFARISLPELVRQFGLVGAAAQYFGTPFCFGIGMDYYVALRDAPCPPTKEGTAKQLLSFYGTNTLLIGLLMLLRTPPLSTLGAYWLLLTGIVLCSFIGTRLSRRRWSFRFTNGGAATALLVHLFAGAYPMVGNWYPDTYENTPAFRRDMGVAALLEWVFLLAITAFTVFYTSTASFIMPLRQMGGMFLLYRMIPYYPFEAFGGGRVLRWKPWLFALLFACSAALFVAAVVL